MQTTLSVEVLERCPVCASDSSRQVLRRDEHYIGEGLCVHECVNCGIAYLSPRLTHDSTESLEDQSTVYDFTPAEIEAGIGWRESIIAMLEVSSGGPGRMLDVGCNRGLLMEAARRRGWQSVGIELSSVAAERARADFGLEVHKSFDDLWALDPFDLVTVWHVLEHTTNPVAFLRQAAAMLKLEGLLAIQVPSFDFVNEFEARDQAGSLLCVVHNFYFTAANLAAMLQRAGLEPIWLDNDPTNLMLTAVCRRAQTSTAPPPPPDSNALRAAQAWGAELEREVAAKNAYIQGLEATIRRLENGRLMRVLRRFGGANGR